MEVAGKGSQPLSRLFEPRAIAVVGASGTPGKAGYMLMQALSGFTGEIYPVNPRADEIAGRPAVASLTDIGSPVDLVIMGIPAKATPDALREAAGIGAGAALVVSGGFGEAGDDGAAIQAELAAICSRTGIRLLGPNTSGFLNPSRGLLATFLPAAEVIGEGSIAVVAQSGGVNLSLAFSAHEEGLGVGLAVGLGNAVDVGVADVVDYLRGRDDIRSIAVHLEGVPDGRRLYDVIARTTRVKPVIALPVGRADVGAFARSHTGNLMGSHALTCAALRQAGAVVVERTTDLVDAAHALACARLDPASDPGVGIVTGQAGPGLIVADYLRHRGVTIPEIAPVTEAEIRTLLPPLTYMKNPVDTGRPSDTFGNVVATLAGDSAVDLVLVYALLEEGAVDMVEALTDAVAKTRKPLVLGTGGDPAIVPGVRSEIEALGIPGFLAPDRAALAAWALVEDARLACRNRMERRKGAAHAIAPGVFDEAQAKDAVDRLGLSTPPRRICEGRDEALAALNALSPPLVAKILRADIHHKTEIGGVHLGITDQPSLDAALDALDAAGANGRYLIEETASPGLELILGARRDPSYGAAVLVGVGGTAAEALGDVQTALAPLSHSDAEAMLDGLRGRALLDGWRGSPRVDREALRSALIALGDCLTRNEWILEIDLNPVRSYENGLAVLDAVILGES